ncbi:MAG: YifB family Mg chelatase-like AAA ATPase [Proteobacteria bacterium]|nr:YifB family Mg chelatase-like AAA ATPase [Pseudomonadota bacterium]
MARVWSAALVGVSGVPVEVEVRVSSQLPRVDVVGLPEAVVRESAARVRAAIASAGLRFPDQRVTVNLAPAALRKDGAALDLPIAVGILAATGEVPAAAAETLAFWGELALDGRLRPVRGALPLAQTARAAGRDTVIVPSACATEAALAPGIRALGAADLTAVVAHLRGERALPASPLPADGPEPTATPCLSEVRGQERAKRALVVAAAGGHHLLLQGAPGSGKSMLARRLPPLQPPLSTDERLEVTQIHSAAERPTEVTGLVRSRPFRSPHHTASTAGLLGGGRPARPGEVSLAHGGVLFLDELPEFSRRSLESLRQVLEEGRVTLARAAQTVVFPARFQLVAASNPCPCGWYQSGVRDCRCDSGAVARYRQRISGPLRDRIDLHVHVPPVRWRDLEAGPEGEPRSATLRLAVRRARERQRARGALNAHLPDRELETASAPTAAARRLLGRAVDTWSLSARAARRVLRVARSLADLEQSERVDAAAMAEALGFRDERDPPH